jgi:hypothetical protein
LGLFRGPAKEITMGCNYYHVMLVGVKLVSVEEIFSTVKTTTYNCKHKDDLHKFCPECGKRSKRNISTIVPKIPMKENWMECLYDKTPTINDKYFLFWDNEYRDDDVYIGVYKNMMDISDSATFLEFAELNKFLPQLSELIEFLSTNNIKVKDGTSGVHIIPFVSC